MRISFCILILLFVFYKADGQSYKFNFYDVEAGLPELFVYDIVQDDNGYLWVATGSGLAKFDGINFTVYNQKNNLPSAFVNKCFIGPGKRIWFGHNNGQVSFYKDHKFSILPIKDSLQSTINDIRKDEQGNIWFAAQSDGLLKVDTNEQTSFFKIPDILIYSFLPVGNHKIVLGTNEGVYLYDTVKKKYDDIDGNPYTAVLSIEKDKNGMIWFGTEDEGLFKIEQGDNLKAVHVDLSFNLKMTKITGLFFDYTGNLWLSSFGNGAYQLKFKDGLLQNSYIYNQSNGLKTNNIKCIFQDTEKIMWFGTYGDGLASMADDYFTFFQNPDKTYKNNMTAIFSIHDQLFIGESGNIIQIDLDSLEKWRTTELFNDQVISALYYDQDENLWIGTEKDGLFCYDLAGKEPEKIHFSDDFLTNSVNCIDKFGNHIWIATKNGLVRYNLESDEVYIYNTSNGLPHNNIKSIYVDNNENVWVATQSNYVYVIKGDSIYKNKLTDTHDIIKINAITLDKKDRLWIATYGNGVFVSKGDKFINVTMENGLKSNYCYSIVQDVNENVWVGHRKGLSRILPDLSVKTYGKDQGIYGDFNSNASFIDRNDRVWLGTTEGLIEYNYRFDKKNEFPPYLNIERIVFSDKEVPVGDEIDMPYSLYKLRIEYVGISFSEPHAVKYKYMLKGYDLDWNVTKDRVINYKRLEDGDYEFLIKAANADGVWSDKPVSVKISISPPLWKRAWFIILCGLAIVYIVYLIIKIRERNHRKMQEYLQKTLDERTHEVVKQKEEIEFQKDKLEQTNLELESKNKDITDSINYAQRIQAAILPPINKLNDIYKQSYIFYRPRDIVSGDFYWFEKIDNKFMVLCADATGHGVPGAFMSLIGITIIKDLIKTHSVDSPGTLLSLLDTEIINTLNQGGVKSRWTNDGYDMSICVLDTKNNTMVFSSAMRPIYIYKDKKLHYIKGTRYPIGGGVIREKKFEEKVIELNKGDAVYMFSDGYPDQFGGIAGKKMKMSRFKNILENIAYKEIQEQKRIIESEFDNWKGEYAQIDDVLLIGIKNI